MMVKVSDKRHVTKDGVLKRNPAKKPELVLVGEDGNAFAILGRARRVALNNGMDWPKIYAEATSGDYNHLLNTMMKYFKVK